MKKPQTIRVSMVLPLTRRTLTALNALRIAAAQPRRAAIR
jgi:hypothetical protein